MIAKVAAPAKTNLLAASHRSWAARLHGVAVVLTFTNVGVLALGGGR